MLYRTSTWLAFPPRSEKAEGIYWRLIIMWYLNEDKNQLSYNKPIFARNNMGETHILLPQMLKNFNYNIEGYNWFDIAKGTYNSCSWFSTVQGAIEQYEEVYKIFNSEIKIEVPENLML